MATPPHGSARTTTRRLGEQRRWPLRPLATRNGLRLLLWLHRRRDAPVLPGAVREHDRGRAYQRSRRGLSLDDRHDGPGHQLAPLQQVRRTTETSASLLRAGRRARTAPRAEGVAREVQG